MTAPVPTTSTTTSGRGEPRRGEQDSQSRERTAGTNRHTTTSHHHHPPCPPRGVMQRLTGILEHYKLSWDDVRKCQMEENWSKRVNESLCQDFSEYCAKGAAKYQHPSLSWTKPRMEPRIRSCLRFGGELALAALRIRAPRLRLRPRGDDNSCRYCGRPGMEHGRHLIFCPALPQDLREAKERVFEAISTESGLHWQVTRRSQEAIESLIIEFDWPRQNEETLKALLVFCRNLINKYAGATPKWERPELAAYPVHRTRPRRSCSTPAEPVVPP